MVQKPCARCKNKNIDCDLVPEEETAASRLRALFSSAVVTSPAILDTNENKFLAIRNAVLASRLDRPLSYSASGLAFDDNLTQREEQARDLPHRMLRIAWDNGWSAKKFKEWFKHMTASEFHCLPVHMLRDADVSGSQLCPPPSTQC